MLIVTLRVPSDLTDEVLALCDGDVAISGVTVLPGASVRPLGDVVQLEVAREAGNDLLQRLREAGVPQLGTITVTTPDTWLSKAGLEAEIAAPGESADAVVWQDVVQRLRSDSRLTWVFGSMITLATLLAAIAIVLDSPILVVGAMILGPDFGAVGAVGVALLRRRWGLLKQAIITLIGGFGLAIAVVSVFGLVCRWIGWITPAQVSGPRPTTDFIYHPDKWSIIVGLIAAAAGVLAITSAKRDGLSGAFVSVTTVPAAANVALAWVFGDWAEMRGSFYQLIINLTAMGVAGWVTLVVQQTVWLRVRKTWRARHH